MKKLFFFVVALCATVVANAAWVKTTSVAVGDEVIIVCAAQSKELNGFSTTKTIYGTGAAFSGSPAGVLVFTVEQGATAGTYALKNGDNYLTWASGNTLTNAGTEVAATTSWEITFDTDDNALIVNSTSNASATEPRHIAWNNNSPRFVNYKTKSVEDYPDSYSTVQLYKQEVVDPNAILIEPAVSKLDFGKHNVADGAGSLTLKVTAQNIDVEGVLIEIPEGDDAFEVDGELTATGGELTITCIATTAGIHEGILYITDGQTEAEVALVAELFALEGQGTKEAPYTVNDVLALNNTVADSCWVTGYIVGYNNNGTIYATGNKVDDTNIVLAATADTEIGKFDATKHVTVQIKDAARTALNIVDNPTNVGKKVKVHGKLEGYFSSNPGVKGTSRADQYEIDGASTALENTTANEAKAVKIVENGQIYILKNGVRYNIFGAEVK